MEPPSCSLCGNVGNQFNGHQLENTVGLITEKNISKLMNKCSQHMLSTNLRSRNRQGELSVRKAVLRSVAGGKIYRDSIILQHYFEKILEG